MLEGLREIQSEHQRKLISEVFIRQQGAGYLYHLPGVVKVAHRYPVTGSMVSAFIIALVEEEGPESVQIIRITVAALVVRIIGIGDQLAVQFA